MKKYRVTWMEGDYPGSRIQYATIITPQNEEDTIEEVGNKFLEDHKKTCKHKHVSPVVIAVELLEDRY